MLGESMLSILGVRLVGKKMDEVLANSGDFIQAYISSQILIADISKINSKLILLNK